MKKTVQFFTKEYLEWTSQLSPEQILEFIENFKQLHTRTDDRSGEKTRLISIKVPENLLNVFKTQAKQSGTPYQTQIKKLMKAWVADPDQDNSIK